MNPLDRIAEERPARAVAEGALDDEARLSADLRRATLRYRLLMERRDPSVAAAQYRGAVLRRLGPSSGEDDTRDPS